MEFIPYMQIDAPIRNDTRGSRPRALIVDDDQLVRDFFTEFLDREGFEPLYALDGETALAMTSGESPDVVLLDLRLPDLDGMEVLQRIKALDSTLPVVIVTGYGSSRQAVDAMRAGAYDFLEKPIEQVDAARILHRAVEDRKLRQTVRILTDRVRDADSLREVMGPSDIVARIGADVARVARSDFAVLITGETGVGKELIARAIHQASDRASGPFVAVDCGAVQETLFENELFGHERGAFTGADRRMPGKFEAAGGGTLFLDEVANMPLGGQAKLLRTLQDRQVTRVGGTTPVDVNIRLVTATNCDLATAVADGTFRQDLFFRINEFAISIPPLRERKQDVIFLAKRFLDLANHELAKTVRGFTGAAVDALLSHAWPGNGRELRSVIRRAVLVADEMIDEVHLALRQVPDDRHVERVPAASPGLPLREQVRRAVASVERVALIEVLQKTAGNKARAARILGIDYKTMHKKLKEYGLTES